MTNTFYYTEKSEKNSSALNGVYYDEKTQRVLVDKGSWDYIYQVERRKDYTDFVDSPSLGRAWRGFKKAYGPAEKVRQASLVDRRYESGTSAAVGTPKGLVETDKTVDSTPDEKKVIQSVDKTFALRGDGTVSINGDNILTGTIAPARKYTVVFTAPGLEGDRKYKAENVTSVDSAVSQLTAIGASLELDFNVKGVYVSFE